MLTKAEAIRRHRILWNWIAQTSIQEQRCVHKREAFVHFEWPFVQVYCWCFAYAYNKLGDNCFKCPVVWDKSYTACCCDFGSEFTRWENANKVHDYITAAKYAYMIAELPERKGV